MVGEGESMGEWRREAPCKRVDRAKKELTGEMKLGFKPSKSFRGFTQFQGLHPVSGASPSFRGFTQFQGLHPVRERHPETTPNKATNDLRRRRIFWSTGPASRLLDGEDEKLCLGDVWCWVC